jgi:hypothetical protein
MTLKWYINNKNLGPPQMITSKKITAKPENNIKKNYHAKNNTAHCKYSHSDTCNALFSFHLRGLIIWWNHNCAPFDFCYTLETIFFLFCFVCLFSHLLLVGWRVPFTVSYFTFNLSLFVAILGYGLIIQMLLLVRFCIVTRCLQ